MKLTRREAIEFLATTAVAAATEQAGTAQQAAAPAGAVTLNWLGGDAPAVGTGVTWGVPFARGTVAKSQTFALASADGTSLPLQNWPLAYWPDGSIKFGAFASVVPAATSGNFRLAPGAPAIPATPLKVQDTANAIDIDTGVLQCTMPKRGADLISSMKRDGREVAKNGRLLCTLENRSNQANNGTLSFDDFLSDIRSAVLESSGPVRAVVKFEGVHKAAKGAREWLPFVVRLYFYAGQEQVRMVHSIVFDGDQEKDFIKGLGIAFAVPMREQVHNRHVHFSGDGEGVWAEPFQPATGRRVLALPGAGGGRGGGQQQVAFESQLAGKRLPNKEAFNPAGQKLLTDWAVWDSYKLMQTSADGFEIQKRTNPQSCWLSACWGKRSSGVVFAGDVSGGLGVGLRNMWQSHPASLEVRNGTQNEADLRVWLWSPDAPAMDMRHYDTKGHDLDSAYEDWQQGFSIAHGVGRTSELTLFPAAAVPTHAETAHNAHLTQQPPLLLAPPDYIHSAKVFGIWSLPDRSTPAKTQLEDHLAAAFSLYHKEVEQRHWYGFWDYGDVRHQHDGPRHEWRYDVGGFAWDNTELGTDVWLWYNFLRTGTAEAFRMAEAITRHTTEVDVYHLGQWEGLGSRHNVRHWGCGAKESRISQAAYRRFYYYLTADERTGDRMRAVVDVDYKLLTLDPMRLASPQKTPISWPARVRGGPDWLAFVGNWMTEWERTNEPKYRDKIIAGMDSIAAMPYGFLQGPNQLYGYDPKTGKLGVIVDDGFGAYNLTTIMGGAEVVFELNDLIDHPGWKKAWRQYGLLVHAGKDVVKRDMTTGTEGADGQFAQYGRLAAYAYLTSKNPALAKKAWSLTRLQTFATTHFDAPAVLNPIDEIPGMGTNGTSQGCLEAIEVLEMCGDQLG
jgi:hypothetical protein